MKNIYEYLDNILMSQGFDAYCEEADKLWELYEKEDDSFQIYCEDNKINLEAEKIVLGSPIEVLQLWVWDHDD